VSRVAQFTFLVEVDEQLAREGANEEALLADAAARLDQRLLEDGVPVENGMLVEAELL
jgi:hypothetical protein